MKNLNTMHTGELHLGTTDFSQQRRSEIWGSLKKVISKTDEKLELEREESYRLLLQTNEQIMSLNKANNELEEFINERDNLRIHLDRKKQYERYKVYFDIKTLESEIRELENQLEFESYKHIKAGDYNEILKINEEIDLSRTQIEDILEKEVFIEQKIIAIDKRVKQILNLNLRGGIRFDEHSCSNKEKELINLKNRKNPFSNNLQLPRLAQLKQEIKRIKMKKTILASLVPVVLLLGLLDTKFILLEIVPISMFLSILIKERHLNKKRVVLEQIRVKAATEEKKIKYKVDKIEREICDILSKHDASSYRELQEKVYKLDEKDELKNEKHVCKNEMYKIKVQKEKLEKYIEDLNLDLDYFLEKNNFRDLNHLNERIRQESKKVNPILESKKIILSNLKFKVDMNKLNEESKYFTFDIEEVNQFEKEGPNYGKQELNMVLQQIETKQLEINKIEHTIELLEMSMANLGKL